MRSLCVRSACRVLALRPFTNKHWRLIHHPASPSCTPFPRQFTWLALLNLAVSAVLVSSSRSDPSLIHGPESLQSPNALPTPFQEVPRGALSHAARTIFIAAVAITLLGLSSVWTLVRSDPGFDCSAEDAIKERPTRRSCTM